MFGLDTPPPFLNWWTRDKVQGVLVFAWDSCSGRHLMFDTFLLGQLCLMSEFLPIP